MQKFYLTTAIAYTNAKPHLGHALEFVFADVIARYHRLKGDYTYFLTGTDEHGSKIYKTAKEAGVEVQAFIDGFANTFINMAADYGLSNDDFIRTTQERHKIGAKKLWEKLVKKGDIYKHSYSGLYCSGCETFMLEKDLVDGKCPNHMVAPELVTEENYFFKLSKYSDQIKNLIETDELKIFPTARKNEMLGLLSEGLIDVSFSRPKSVLPHGINVPGDETQVMYVWCDALTNYITALEGDLFDRYWPCDLHIIGKDILRFHAGVWIGMLLSADIDLPKAVGVHGFITSDGKKMSKSLGNVVDPIELLKQYPVDAIRFYLTREIPTGDDGDFSHERFKVVYESDLANNFGNLASRSVAMLHKYFDGVVPNAEFKFEAEFDSTFKRYSKAIENFDLKKALESVLEFLTILNQHVENTKPWDLAKNGDSENLKSVIYTLIEGVKRGAVLLYPYIPNTAQKLAEVYGLNLDSNFSNLINLKLQNTKLQKLEPLFPRSN